MHEDLCAVTDGKGRVRHQFTADAANELWIGDITASNPIVTACPAARSSELTIR